MANASNNLLRSDSELTDVTPNSDRTESSAVLRRNSPCTGGMKSTTCEVEFVSKSAIDFNSATGTSLANLVTFSEIILEYCDANFGCILDRFVTVPCTEYRVLFSS